MNVIVNGQPRDIPVGTSLRALVEQSNLSVDKVAIEVNRRLVRSANNGYDRILNENDEIEIVTFVGGG